MITLWPKSFCPLNNLLSVYTLYDKLTTMLTTMPMSYQGAANLLNLA